MRIAEIVCPASGPGVLWQWRRRSPTSLNRLKHYPAQRGVAEKMRELGTGRRILAFATSSIGSFEIQPDDFRVPARQRKGDIARATANVQRPVTWLHARQFDAPALPPPVQPEALNVVDQVITPRNRSEQVGRLFQRAFDPEHRMRSPCVRTD